MSQLNYPVSKDGMLVDVLIGLDHATSIALLAAGQPITAPIRARGVVDTGTDVTVVNASILHRLGIPVQYQTSTQTVAGSLGVRIFEVSLGITDFGDPSAPELVEPNLLVMEMTSALPVADVLIGLDVLLSCKLLLDGPARHFMLDF
jgi:hypothetical protein